jgi:hypothetical protein
MNKTVKVAIAMNIIIVFVWCLFVLWPNQSDRPRAGATAERELAIL